MPTGPSDRRRALVATSRLPWPLDDGGRIALWQTVWSAARAYDVSLVCFVPPGTEREPLPDALRALCAEVVRVPHRPPSRWAAAWSGAVGRWPYTLARYRDPAFERALRAVIAERAPAFALVSPLHIATYADAIAPTPLVLRAHNVEHRWMARYAATLGFGPAGLYARVQAARLRVAEAGLCRRAALVLAIQEEEAERFRALAPEARVATVPLGIDLGRFGAPEPADPPIVLMAGSFAWPPNAAGARRFLDEGWPRVAAAAPAVRLRLAGKDPPAALAGAARRAGAEVAGHVDSMPREFARAAVLVVPLWAGAGARVKIVEALAAGLPVVSTPVGAEGLGLSDGTHVLLAESPAALADRVLDLLAAPARRDALRHAGQALARERWSLDAAARTQNALCGEVVR